MLGVWLLPVCKLQVNSSSLKCDSDRLTQPFYPGQGSLSAGRMVEVEEEVEEEVVVGEVETEEQEVTKEGEVGRGGIT